MVDLTKKNQIKKKLVGNYTHVINLSGYTLNLYRKKYKKKILKSHFNSTKNLINFFEKKGIKNFVQIGSSAEYGNAKEPQKETLKCKPNTVYGKAKLRATNYTLSFAKKNDFPANVIRLFQVYGPNQGEARAVTQLMKYCIKNKKFPASDGKQIRDFCYIDDVIRAIILLLKKDMSGNIINIGYGKGISMKKLIFSIQKVARGGSPKFGIFKSRNHENPSLVPCILRAKKLLKWQPKIKLVKGLEKTKNFLVENG